ncbi:hypothetical protein Tco_0298886 [Tanacetum coccineum]
MMAVWMGFEKMLHVGSWMNDHVVISSHEYQWTIQRLVDPPNDSSVEKATILYSGTNLCRDASLLDLLPCCTLLKRAMLSRFGLVDWHPTDLYSQVVVDRVNVCVSAPIKHIGHQVSLHQGRVMLENGQSIGTVTLVIRNINWRTSSLSSWLRKELISLSTSSDYAEI